MDDLRASVDVGFVLNGSAVRMAPEPGERLSYALRERLGAREVKIGCNAGDCGACSVLVEGDVVCACLMAAHQAAGKRVETVRGLIGWRAGAGVGGQFSGSSGGAMRGLHAGDDGVGGGFAARCAAPGCGAGAGCFGRGFVPLHRVSQDH